MLSLVYRLYPPGTYSTVHAPNCLKYYFLTRGTSRGRRVTKTKTPNRHKLTRSEHKMTFMRNFVKDEQGQDLIEYTLLMAFVALASAALFIGAGGSVKGIWSTSNSQLAAASASTGT